MNRQQPNPIREPPRRVVFFLPGDRVKSADAARPGWFWRPPSDQLQSEDHISKGEFMSKQSTMHSAALKYACEGFRIFPLKGKVPRTKNGFYDATTDKETIREVVVRLA